jgi:hypothetical protein
LESSRLDLSNGYPFVSFGEKMSETDFGMLKNKNACEEGREFWNFLRLIRYSASPIQICCFPPELAIHTLTRH